MAVMCVMGEQEDLSQQTQDSRASLKMMRSKHSGGTDMPEISPASRKYKCPICRDTQMVCVSEEGVGTYRVCECRELENQRKRLRFASIPKEFESYTVESFDLGAYKSPEAREKAEMAKLICANYVRMFSLLQGDGKGLYMHSRVKGSGKTRMAASVANDLMRIYGIPAKFTTALQILDEIKQSWGEPGKGAGERQLLQDVLAVPILVMDDIGVERPSKWVDEKFYSILNGRMVQKRVTIFTSNCEIENLLFDDRITNRIMRMAVPVAFPNESVRSLLAKAENKELYRILTADSGA